MAVEETNMDECQIVLGVEEGRRVRAQIEDLSGAPCPCIQGRRCPLLKPLGSDPV